jgi:hypothetical protein
METKESPLLKPMSEIRIPAHATFDSRERWVPGFRGKAENEIKFSWFQPEFKDNYLGLRENRESGKLVNEPLGNYVVEYDVPERIIVVSKLLREARDPEIIKALVELGGSHTVALAHVLDVLAMQPNGEYGSGEGLRVNHFENIVYSPNRNGVDRSISFDWFNPGWSMATDPVGESVEDEQREIELNGSWRVGDYVLCYK